MTSFGMFYIELVVSIEWVEWKKKKKTNNSSVTFQRITKTAPNWDNANDILIVIIFGVSTNSESITSMCQTSMSLPIHWNWFCWGCFLEWLIYSNLNIVRIICFNEFTCFQFFVFASIRIENEFFLEVRKRVLLKR